MQNAIVIGMGEVGNRLANALEASGTTVDRVTRTEGWDAATADSDAPRIVCVREDALETVLDRLEGVDPSKVVAVQNGWVRPICTRRSVVNRGLIWFMSKGDYFNPLRTSPFAGPLATELVDALAGGGLSVETVDDASFAASDADKMGFNCVVGLPLAVHGLSLGDYLTEKADEAEAAFTEAVTVCARAAGTEVDDSWWPEFVKTVKPLHWVATSKAKALDLRNGAVTRLGDELGIATPVNKRLLASV